MTSQGKVCRAHDARQLVWCLMCALLAIVCGTSNAHAEEANTPTLTERLKQWKVDVKKHKSAKDVKALKADFETAKQLYADAASDEKLRGQILDALGRAPKGVRNVDVPKAMLFAIADLGDVRAAKYVKPYLKQPDKKKASVLLDVAVAAASDLPHPTLVEPLLAIVLKSKHNGIVHDAVRALGKFGKCKKKRVKILETLVKTAEKSKPGGRPRMRGPKETMDGGMSGDPGAPQGREGGPGARWSTLSSSVPPALSELTGIKQSQLADWLELARQNKGKLRRLFQDDDD